MTRSRAGCYASTDRFDPDCRAPAAPDRIGSTEGPRLFVAILNNAVVVHDQIVKLENLLHKKTSASTKSRASVPKKSTVAPRAANGKIQRSAAARKEFMRQAGYPKGRKGYVVDHIVPLECGGADTPANMQWQTSVEAEIKDRTERNCRRE